MCLVCLLYFHLCACFEAFRFLFPQYYMTQLFINTSTNIFWGFTSQNRKWGNVACWMCIMCHVWLYGKRTEVWSLTPLSLIKKKHDEGGALLNTLLREVHEMWTLENGQTLTTDEGAIFSLSFFRKSVLLTPQCPFLEMSWETRGTSHASGLLMENRETSQWMKNITNTRVQSGRTMERGRNTL